MEIEKWWKGPSRSKPDFDNVLKILHKHKPARPTLFEFALNEKLQLVLAPECADWPKIKKFGQEAMLVRAYRNAGYDCACIHGANFYFPVPQIEHRNTISLNAGATIIDRDSFAAYAWPDPDIADYSLLDAMRPYLDDNMKLATYGHFGVLEIAIQLVGFENLCLMLNDDAELAASIFDAIGSRLLKYYQHCLEYETVGAIIGNDDWGFKTQTMLSIKDMRRYVFPWHKKFVAAAHAHGKPAILHSCGNLSGVMADITDDIGYDGKHSYEDAIMPVETAYENYHEKIAVLGGLDLDFMVNAAPEMVYERSVAMLESSRDRGGYALGTGNSVPEYVPDANYFAMIAAAHK